MRAAWILVGVFCLGGCSESGDVFFTSVGSTGSTGSTGTGTASISSASSTGGGDGGATSSSASTGGGGGGGGEGGEDAGTDGPCVPNPDPCAANPAGHCAPQDDGCGTTVACMDQCGMELACATLTYTCVCSFAPGGAPKSICAIVGDGMGEPYYCGPDNGNPNKPPECEFSGKQDQGEWIWCCNFEP